MDLSESNKFQCWNISILNLSRNKWIKNNKIKNLFKKINFTGTIPKYEKFNEKISNVKPDEY